MNTLFMLTGLDSGKDGSVFTEKVCLNKQKNKKYPSF